MRRWPRILLLTVAAGLLAPWAPAAAAPPDEYGSWWRLQTGTGPVLSPPPGVPADGLWIANDPSGEQAVSAARIAPAASGGRVTSLTVTVAGSTGTPAVRACLATPGWSAARVGSWASRPAARCDAGQVPGVASKDGTTWSFPVGALADAATNGVDVVLVPAAGGGTFSLSFRPPDDNAFTVSSAPGGTAPGASASSGAEATSSAQTEPAGPTPALGANGEREDPRSGVDPSSFATGGLGRDAVPSFAAPLSGTSSDAFDRDVSLDLSAAAEGTAAPIDPANIGNSDVATLRVPRATRQPLALVAAVLLVGAWVWRTRVAVQTSAAHPLSVSLAIAGNPDALRRAESLLTAGEPELEVAQ